MRVIATTVVRESIRGKQKTGWIYDVDWDAQTVLRKLPVPDPSFPESDDNPRGGVRGGRGVAPTQHGIVVANYDTLYVYDDDWNVVQQLSHPLFVGTHEIDWDGERLWTAATGIDAVLRVSLDGDVDVAWDPHAPELADRFGIRRRPHAMDGSVDYRIREAPVIDQCHINGVARRGDATVVNCGLVRKTKPFAARATDRLKRKLGIGQGTDGKKPRHSGTSMVVRVNGSGQGEVLVELGNHDFPTHNGQLLEDGRVALNDSTNNTLRVYTVGDRSEVAALQIPGTWLRGLEPLDASRVLVGTAPATIVLADLAEKHISGKLQLSDDPNEAIHGLAVCPPAVDRR
jgi:hypothetical protein